MKSDRKLILINHRFFDGIENRLQDGKSIVVNGGRIEAIENSLERPRDSEYAIVDMKGLTLLPGLIDNHVHIALPLISRPSNRIAPSLDNSRSKANPIDHWAPAVMAGVFLLTLRFYCESSIKYTGMNLPGRFSQNKD